MGGGVLLAGASSAYACRLLTTAGSGTRRGDVPLSKRKWGMVVDLTRCRPGCNACVEACREENNVAHHGDGRWDVLAFQEPRCRLAYIWPVIRF